jgi:sugar lactone lactonase YvrE
VLTPVTASAADLTLVGQFGGVIGSGPGQFTNPDDLAVDSAGNVYVADTTNNRIQKLAADGTFLSQFGTLGSGAGQLTNPNAVAVDLAGNAYVADRSNHRVMQFDSAGGFVRGWGWSVDSAADGFETCTAGSGCEIGTAVDSATKSGGFFAPHAIAVDAAGNVYVSEFAGDQRVQRFEPAPIVSYVTGWGSPGSAAGQFARPVGLALDAAPNVFVADRDNSRVQKFTSGGSFLQTIGSLGPGDGQFNVVEDVAVDPDGNLWVAESNNRRVQKFTPDGVFLATYKTYQPGAGDFVPAAIAFSPAGDLYVIDSQAGENFRILRLREPAAPPSTVPPPVLGRAVNVAPVKGTVRIGVRSSGSGARASQKGIRFVPLTEARQVPVGSFLDTRRGTVQLSSARNSAGTTQSGQFTAGVFQVLQSRKRAAKGLTELQLKGSSATSCPSTATAGADAARLSRRTLRRLRASARGRFRTRGRHSAATVRGTIWITADRCDGTLTTVKRGKVAVRDFRRRKTIVVGAGKSYLAKAAG